MKSLAAGTSAARAIVHLLPKRLADIDDGGQFHYAVLGPSSGCVGTSWFECWPISSSRRCKCCIAVNGRATRSPQNVLACVEDRTQVLAALESRWYKGEAIVRELRRRKAVHVTFLDQEFVSVTHGKDSVKAIFTNLGIPTTNKTLSLTKHVFRT
ncbi:MAG: hypothetical protein OWU33_10775 [Firmicutes bacterium]|nr:hypothetical protein [Bacillota bacterium]